MCLPLELSGEDAAALIDFLYQLVEALERHYRGLLLNRIHELAPSLPPDISNATSDDPPF
ncbi:MAG: hypothetical protein ACREU3_10375 [Steroidobacteraceae bacterium]